MGVLISAHPAVISAVMIIAGLVVITVLGYIIYKYVNRKKFKIKDFNVDDNINDELTLRSNNYARALNAL